MYFVLKLENVVKQFPNLSIVIFSPFRVFTREISAALRFYNEMYMFSVKRHILTTLFLKNFPFRLFTTFATRFPPFIF